MFTTLAPTPIYRSVLGNNQPNVGGLLYTYVAGTSTPLTTYMDSAGTQNTNPIILNARGEASIWLGQGLSYKFVQQDASGNPMYSQDNISNIQNPRSAVVTANESRSNIAVPANSSYLFGSIPGAGSYEYVVNFAFTTSVNAGFAGNINFSGSFSYGQFGAYGIWSVFGGGAVAGQVYSNVTGVAASQSTVSFSFAPGAYTGQQTVFATGIITTTSAGIIALAWSQNVAQAAPTILLAGSYGKLTQIA